MNVLAEIGQAFVLGLLTPLGAVCVLPLYPGFLVYLAGQLPSTRVHRYTMLLFGLIVTGGVIVFMVAIGLIFTTILEVSLQGVIGIVSPIAFGVLFVISLLLIFDVDIGRFLPKVRSPVGKNPWISAAVYGLFFGAIVIPCNPLFIAALFTQTVSAGDFAANMLSFLFFGIGIGFPLLVLAAISAAWTDKIMDFLTGHRTAINRVAGVLMLAASVYYLVFVFMVFERLFD